MLCHGSFWFLHFRNYFFAAWTLSLPLATSAQLHPFTLKLTTQYYIISTAQDRGSWGKGKGSCFYWHCNSPWKQQRALTSTKCFFKSYNINDKRFVFFSLLNVFNAVTVAFKYNYNYKWQKTEEKHEKFSINNKRTTGLGCTNKD